LDGFADAQACVDRQLEDGPVAGAGVGLDGPQPSQCRSRVQCAGCVLGQIEAIGVSGAQAEACVEVIDGSEGVVSTSENQCSRKLLVW